MTFMILGYKRVSGTAIKQNIALIFDTGKFSTLAFFNALATFLFGLFLLLPFDTFKFLDLQYFAFMDEWSLGLLFAIVGFVDIALLVLGAYGREITTMVQVGLWALIFVRWIIGRPTAPTTLFAPFFMLTSSYCYLKIKKRRQRK